jgi:hypothetical protein
MSSTLSTRRSSTHSAAETASLLDVQGRFVDAIRLGPLNPGRHVVRLNENRRLASGVYVVRLVQAGETATSKFTKVR